MVFKKIKSGLIRIVDTFYSIYFNFKIFPVNIAYKLPLKVSYKIKLIKFYKGCIQIDGLITRNMIILGSLSAPFIRKENSAIYCSKNGKIIFKGKANFAEGIKIYVESGELIFGENIYIGANTSIQCENKITIGNDFLGGWNLCIRDTDGHMILQEGVSKPMNGKILIHDKVWIAADCTVLKDSNISKGSIIGCKSLVCGLKMDEENCLAVGSPAKIIKKKVQWIE